MSSMERDEVTIIESNRTMAILSLSLSVSLSHYFSLTRSFPYYTYTFETTLHRGQQYYCESLKARYKDRRFAIFSKRTKTIRIDERRCSSLATPPPPTPYPIPCLTNSQTSFHFSNERSPFSVRRCFVLVFGPSNHTRGRVCVQKESASVRSRGTSASRRPSRRIDRRAIDELNIRAPCTINNTRSDSNALKGSPSLPVFESLVRIFLSTSRLVDSYVSISRTTIRSCSPNDFRSFPRRLRASADSTAFALFSSFFFSFFGCFRYPLVRIEQVEVIISSRNDIVDVSILSRNVRRYRNPVDTIATGSLFARKARRFSRRWFPSIRTSKVF